MQNMPLPRDASSWAELLISLELPSICANREEIMSALGDENPSATKLAEQIGTDPVLSFRILAAANKAFKGRDDSVRSLAKAINVLGLGQIQQMTKALPHRPELAASTEHSLYSHAIGTSLLAARIAHALSPQHQPAHAEEAYWCALLQGVPIWHLFYHASEAARQLPAVAPRLTATQPELDLFGCGLYEIGVTCAKHFSLPDLTQKSLTEPTFRYKRQLACLLEYADQSVLVRPREVEQRDLKIFLQRPEFIVSLANMLAWEAMEDWYSPRTEKIHGLAAVLTRETPNNWVTHCHRLCVDVSREHPFPNLMSAAARLMLTQAPAGPVIRVQAVPASSTSTPDATATDMPPNTDSTDQAVEDNATTKAQDSEAAPSVDTAAASTPESQPPQVAEPQQNSPGRGGNALFQELTQSMLNNPQSFLDVAQLMNAAVRAACFGIGFERSVIALVNRQRTRLKALYTAGTASSPELARFEVDLERPSLFRKLLEKSAAIWIKPTSSAKIWAMIPDDFRRHAARDEFFLMSTFMQNRPVAIVYADHPSGTLYTEEQYELFKFLCQSVSFVLRQMADRQAAPQQ